MIFVFENGRLGNQLFQYVGIRKLFPNSLIFLSGFDSLFNMFDEIRAIRLLNNKNIYEKLFTRILRFGLIILAKIRIIGTLTEVKGRYGSEAKVTRGIICGVYLCHSFFNQNSTVNGDMNCGLKVNSLLSKIANKKFNQITEGVTNRRVIFVHVRRGDYVSWPSNTMPAVLPGTWYLKMMEEFAEIIENPIFLIVTDDVKYAINLLKNRRDIIISSENEAMDFALMIKCSGGILSASTFSLWAAYFGYIGGHENPIYIAPLYWVGHAEKKWNPQNFIFPWLSYRSVEQ